MPQPQRPQPVRGSTVDPVPQSIRSGSNPVEVRHLGSIEYLAAWQVQRELADARVTGGPDTLLLLEHPEVYTAGKRTEAHERPAEKRFGRRFPSSKRTAAARSPGTARGN